MTVRRANSGDVRKTRAMNKLFVLNRLRWPLRIPVKWAIFAVVVLLVCFPYPHMLIRHVRHWRDPDALIAPDAQVLRPFVEELLPLLDNRSPEEALEHVERYVYEKIPYEWDWNTWGVADYLPTVEEVMEKGVEDCDGRAVIAASLLRDARSTALNLKIAECGYSTSAAVASFRPDYAIIDCSMGKDRSKDIVHHLKEDPRIPYVHVILAAKKDEFPEDCDREVFARMATPFGIAEIDECVGRLRREAAPPDHETDSARKVAGD